jgi:tartrate dehydrogenase/decarboxylase/D-malate dehydrogenase
VGGGAPDIAGLGVANPLAAFWSASLLLDHLGESRAAADLLAAVEALVASGRVLTPDLGGQASTSQVTDALLAQLEVGA